MGGFASHDMKQEPQSCLRSGTSGTHRSGAVRTGLGIQACSSGEFLCAEFAANDSVSRKDLPHGTAKSSQKKGLAMYAFGMKVWFLISRGRSYKLINSTSYDGSESADAHSKMVDLDSYLLESCSHSSPDCSEFVSVDSDLLCDSLIPDVKGPLQTWVEGFENPCFDDTLVGSCRRRDVTAGDGCRVGLDIVLKFDDSHDMEWQSLSWETCASMKIALISADMESS